MSRSEARNATVESGLAEAGPVRAELAAEVWREHRGWVAAVVRAHMPYGADADDLLQEVAMKLVQHMDTLDSPERIGPWLRTVAINLSRSAGRRHGRTSRIFQPLGETEPSRDDSYGRQAESRGGMAMEIAESLPPHYRDPLFLSLRGLSYKQIGLVMDLPMSTIETRLSRARAMVRDELRAADERESGELPASGQATRTFKAEIQQNERTSALADEEAR